MFWIIFATASFTALVVSWAIAFILLRNMSKSQQYARKRGFCPTCGAPQMSLKQMVKKGAIGFKSQHE